MNILEINNVDDFILGGSNYEGIQIKTDDKDILVLIYNSQSCCEEFGYVSSLDKFDDFVGAEILNVTLTDDALATTKIELDNNSIDISSCYFVNVDTNKGLLQFTLYNQHNGYYGHDVKVLVGNDFILDGII